MDTRLGTIVYSAFTTIQMRSVVQCYGIVICTQFESELIWQAHRALLDEEEKELTQFIFTEDQQHLTINPEWLAHLEASVNTNIMSRANKETMTSP